MKTNIFFLVIFLLFPAAFCAAEWFDGDIEKIDLKTQELTVTEVDPITEVEEAEVISILPATTFSGVTGLKDIRPGDEVSVEAKYDEASDSWQALSVEVSGAGE